MKVDDLAKQIMKEMEAYKNTVTSVVKESCERVANEAVKELREESPKLTGDYKKGWRKTKRFENASKVKFSVNNKTDYQLTHLLENGRANRNGGRTQPVKHIKKVDDIVREKLEEEIRREL